MAERSVQQDLQEFFKAVAEPKRLRIVGLLAQKSYSGDQLAAMLELSESTVSHHVSYLVHAGLVSAEPQGYYTMYSLRLDAIHGIAQRLMSRDELPKLAEGVDMDAYDRKVLANFTDASGRIKQIPAQGKKFEVLLRYLVQKFEPGKRYTEKQVNEILAQYHQDTALLRRCLIDYKYMARESTGGAYWRIDEPAAQEEAA